MSGRIEDDSSKHLAYNNKKGHKSQFNSAKASNLRFMVSDNLTLFPTFGTPAYEVNDSNNYNTNYKLSSISDISNDTNTNNRIIGTGGRLLRGGMSSS
jgi:hypothetical protein